MPSTHTENRLGNASSPYLLQHRANPVHWQEWGTEALELAQRLDRPVLLSIGYAACHWCHVMAHESFEDAETAALMNDLFVNIKVDREERPDVDQIYMEALHRMGVQGGWPLTMFLTPDGRPYWGGTYFPRYGREGYPSFKAVLAATARAWRENRDDVEHNARIFLGAIRDALSTPTAGKEESFTRAALDRFVSQSVSMADTAHGGIGEGPKFPNAPLWEAIWHQARSKPSGSESRRAALLWLHALSQGGIYDHLGGGLHRYAVDSKWLVPHFEKMLYDSALYLRCLNLAGGAKNELFRKRIEETVAFLQRDMLEPGAGLVSSYDADSEGEEGLFYVWSEAEIRQCLPPGEADLFTRIYDVSTAGNWEGRNILHRLHPNGESADPAQESQLDAARALLVAMRNKRTPPGRDDKILTDWNGLAIRAVAECSFSLDRPDWLHFAEDIFRYVCESSDREGRLPHASRSGRSIFPAVLTDIAAMVNAAITLYALTGKLSYREKAELWINQGFEHHGDGEGGFYYTAADARDLLFRSYQDRDEATPAASGQWLEALQRHALVLSDAGIQEKTDRLAAILWGRIHRQPHGFAGIVNALAFHLEPKKLVLFDPGGELIDVTRRFPDPVRIDMLRADPLQAAAEAGSPIPACDNEKPAAWFCDGPVCLPPVFDAASLEALVAPRESG